MSGKKILVADDSLTIQKVIRLALSNEGYEIQAISDGADAIQHIATFRPDVVLIDISLPSRSAFEIKREANSMPDHPGIKFILMSSAFEKIDEAQAAEVGFDGRLTKPFDPAHLRQILTDVLHTAMAPPSQIPDFSPPEMPELPKPPSEIPTIEAPSMALPTASDDELWGKHEEPAAPPPRIPGDDIKQLTESTIRMSGLADMPNLPKEESDWQINEPSIQPPGSLSDLGGSTFQISGSSRHQASRSEIELDHSPTPQQAPSFSMSDDPKIEEIVRSQVQATLEKLAKQILPEVAERVIKAEINRLLNEKI